MAIKTLFNNTPKLFRTNFFSKPNPLLGQALRMNSILNKDPFSLYKRAGISSCTGSLKFESNEKDNSYFKKTELRVPDIHQISPLIKRDFSSNATSLKGIRAIYEGKELCSYNANIKKIETLIDETFSQYKINAKIELAKLLFIQNETKKAYEIVDQLLLDDFLPIEFIEFLLDKDERIEVITIINKMSGHIKSLAQRRLLDFFLKKNEREEAEKLIDQISDPECRASAQRALVEDEKPNETEKAINFINKIIDEEKTGDDPVKLFRILLQKNEIEEAKKLIDQMSEPLKSRFQYELVELFLQKNEENRLFYFILINFRPRKEVDKILRQKSEETKTKVKKVIDQISDPYYQSIALIKFLRNEFDTKRFLIGDLKELASMEPVSKSLINSNI